MEKYKIYQWLLYVFGVISLVFSAQSFAGKDDLAVTNFMVNVDGFSVGSTSTFGGNNRKITIINPIIGVKSVSIQATWTIIPGSDPRDTSYPKYGVGFTATQTQGTNVGPITVNPATCDFTNASATCSTTISFNTPDVNDSTMQITVTPTNTGSGKSSLQGRHLEINFTVLPVIQQVAKKDTVLVVPDPQCFAYQGGDVNLSANLTELLSDSPISGRDIDFSVDSSWIGENTTESNGTATLVYNINHLTAGDHPLYAEFLGDSEYNPSNDSATLGIYYNFVGFQSPINPAGNSIFGNGRVIPIKIKIVDANLNPITDANPTVWLYQWASGTGLGEMLAAATSVSSADTGNIMRYSPEDQGYHYNWDLSELTNGTYAVVVELGDSKACGAGPYYATITVDKKGKK